MGHHDVACRMWGTSAHILRPATMTGVLFCCRWRCLRKVRQARVSWSCTFAPSWLSRCDISISTYGATADSICPCLVGMHVVYGDPCGGVSVSRSKAFVLCAVEDACANSAGVAAACASAACMLRVMAHRHMHVTCRSFKQPLHTRLQGCANACLSPCLMSNLCALVPSLLLLHLSSLSAPAVATTGAVRCQEAAAPGHHDQ